jgi:hypothetical protein
MADQISHRSTDGGNYPKGKNGDATIYFNYKINGSVPVLSPFYPRLYRLMPSFAVEASSAATKSGDNASFDEGNAEHGVSQLFQSLLIGAC